MVPTKSVKVVKKLTPADVRAAIHQLCEKNNYDPFQELISIATETFPSVVDGVTLQLPVADVDQRISIAREIASYLAPKLKSIEVEGQIKGDFSFKITHFDESGKQVEGMKMADVVAPVIRQIGNEVEEEVKDA